MGLRWMPSHRRKMVARWLRLSHGARAKAPQWRANQLVDALAKMAAKRHRFPKAAIEMHEQAKAAVRHHAALLRAVTHASCNNRESACR